MLKNIWKGVGIWKPPANRIQFQQWSQSVRCVGNYKRSFDIELPPGQDILLKDVLAANRSVNDKDWHEIRTKLLSSERSLSEVNIDAAIVGFCQVGRQLNVARSYIEFLRKNGKTVNLATAGKYLKTFYNVASNDRLTDDDKLEILALSNEILQKSPIVDATTCENLIHALSLTNEWERCFDLLEMSKITAKPSSVTYSIIIAKAFEANSVSVAWKLMHEMIEESNRMPKCFVFTKLIEKAGEMNGTDGIDFLNEILRFIGKHQVVVSNRVINELIEFYKARGFRCQKSSILKSGKCTMCKKHLKSVYLSTDEFKQLSTNFLNLVLIRKNVFLKSTPQEVQRFETFLLENGPFDCIVDGLNVAYGAGRKTPLGGSKAIASVVKHFNNRGKRILVLGRKHMQKWPTTQMNYIQKNSKLFLTEDLSQDDPFLLYAALKCGPGTDFCSNDLMRGHAFLLGAELQPLFRRWQQEHQHSFEKINEYYTIAVKDPIKFMTCAHQVGGIWHIPFSEEWSAFPTQVGSEITNSWLCISSTSI